ncbi:outer membrane protein transport protein [Psychrobacter okhotskensis]|uniref:outer membrane protein transport protein n=1 Tax=Psychrobacter okhotskensis TaxID=212403 RepID=UPI003D06F3E7
MSQKFPISKLTLALLTLSAASLTQAAGLDRSGQEIKGFFNPGTYAEVDFAYIDTKVSAHDNAGAIVTPAGEIRNGITSDEASYEKGVSTGNATPDEYSFMRYGVKTDVNENISIGVFYDEPFGAEVEYSGDNAFVSKAGKQTIADSSTGTSVLNEEINPSVLDPNYDKNTNVSVHTETWTGLVGFKSNGFQVYGGPVMQKVKADVHLRGQAYGPLTGYDANVNSDTDYGWVAGLAYSKPEIALNAALTYRSEIDHKTAVGERVPLLNGAPLASLGGASLKDVALGKLGIDPNSALGQSIGEYATTDATVTTPESVNLNIQTGLSEKYQLLGTLDVRWVPWSDFSIVPPLYNAYSKAAVEEGLPLLSYEKDQWKVDVGLAKRFNEKLAGSVVVGYDSGAGDPVSSLGTIEGYYSFGGGVKYNVTPEWAVSVGGKYLKFGDATGQLPNGSIVSKAEDNDGYIAGVKLSYQSQ